MIIKNREERDLGSVSPMPTEVLTSKCLPLLTSPQRRRFNVRLAVRVVATMAVIFLAVIKGVAADPGGIRPHEYEGFGSDTPGGEGQPVYHVTHLGTSGAGSLADALSEGYRYVVFDVGGTIPVPAGLSVGGPYVTIDGFTAPQPGITLEGKGLRIDGRPKKARSRDHRGRGVRLGVHDVIVRGLRIVITDQSPGSSDGISIVNGAHHVVIDHCYISDASDEDIGINDAHDVTVSWTIMDKPNFSLLHPTLMLVTNGASRISIHHNLFLGVRRRSPWVSHSVPGKVSAAPEVSADIRNNLMWEISGDPAMGELPTHHGTVAFGGAKVNIINNYYKTIDGASVDAQHREIVICARGVPLSAADLAFCSARLVQFPVPTLAYVSGNVSHEGWTDLINAKGTEVEPFSSPPTKTSDACVAAADVLDGAGLFPGQGSHFVSKSQLACP